MASHQSAIDAAVPRIAIQSRRFATFKRSDCVRLTTNVNALSFLFQTLNLELKSSLLKKKIDFVIYFSFKKDIKLDILEKSESFL